jgi:hypothetical protein
MPRKRIDLTGKIFGRLKVIGFSHTSNSGCVHWDVICSCGNKAKASTSNLRGNRVRSCGCLTHSIFITIDGKTQSMTQWCKEKGISYDTAWARIHNYGWTPYDAITTPTETLVVIDGKSQTLSEWCKEKGININTVHARVNKLGWTPHDAITLPSRGIGKEFSGILVTIGGKTQSVKQWIKKNGIKYNTARFRIVSGGWTLCDAVTIPVGSRGGGWSAVLNRERKARSFK